MRGLKQTYSDGADRKKQTNKETHRQTSQLRDWVGPVGQFSKNVHILHSGRVTVWGELLGKVFLNKAKAKAVCKWYC